MARFKLSESFIEEFQNKQPPFGFDGLGEFVYRRTYSRVKPDGSKEEWWETCQRVVEFIFNEQKKHVEFYNTGWNAWKAQKSAQEMYARMFTFKWLPPGRGLWAAGTPITEEKGLYAALNNCAFISTTEMENNAVRPFTFLMDMSMLGVGVGFDLKGADKIFVPGPKQHKKNSLFVVPDTREGWVDSVDFLLRSYFHGNSPVVFDYSEVRGPGEPIKVFGGTSSGPEPLKKAHELIRDVLNDHIGRELSATGIADIMNIIGMAVISGNVRRSAEIILAEPTEEYLNLKNYKEHPERAEYGWSSNNSVLLEESINDYSHFVEHIVRNGEPGFAWLNNMQAYSRMSDPADFKDSRASGGNPCLEQTLESYELCTLVETFPANHESIEDYIETLKYAYMYAKTITLLPTHWPETNAVLLRNRRIGCSISGIAQAIAKEGIQTFRGWLEQAYSAIERYDEIYSEWFAIPTSIKKTSVKPSGTVSLLVGATPGVHFPISQYYIRRIRISKFSDLVQPLIDAGYHVEPDLFAANTVVVDFPIALEDGVRTLEDVTIWEQLEIAAFMQAYWADNQVSCTVTFKPEEANQIATALQFYQYRLKGISLLPASSDTYPQMPYEKISKEQYLALTKQVTHVHFEDLEEALGDKYCDSDVCVI